MEAHDVMKAMAQRARELGWAVETNWRDNSDGTDSYDVYLWQVSGSEPAPEDPQWLEYRGDQLAGVVENLAQTLALRDGELASANAQRDHARANALMEVGEAMSPTGEWPPEAIGEVIPAVRAMARRERDRGDDTNDSSKIAGRWSRCLFPTQTPNPGC